MRNSAVFLLLLAIKAASRLLFRVRLEFVREVDDPWAGLRVVALLNHTSLFEPVLTAVAPNRLLWQIAAHGVLPVADKTLARPIIGRLYRFVARRVVRVTRRRDETWADVLERLHDEEALIVILPEGRMKRRTGLDLDGNPMTIRGGIADILESVPDGRLFIGYRQRGPAPCPRPGGPAPENNPPHASKPPNSSRPSSPISPRATPTVATAPARRRSIRLSPNPRPSHLLTAPAAHTTAPLRLASCATRPPPPFGRAFMSVSCLSARNLITSTACCLLRRLSHQCRTRQRPDR